MPHLLFVYGTLKEGFFNHPINEGRRVPGTFATVERFGLYLIGARFLPWMVALEQPDQPGEHVQGELYEVDDAALARMDVLERVTDPGWYRRVDLLVRPVQDAQAAPTACQVYLAHAPKLKTEPVHCGPLVAYTPELAAQYRYGGPLPQELA
jgi:gamma-glutamylaminecyclotransferase